MPKRTLKRTLEAAEGDNRHLKYSLTREESIVQEQRDTIKKQKHDLAQEHQQRITAEQHVLTEHQQRVVAEQQRVIAEQQAAAEHQQRLLAERVLDEQGHRIVQLTGTIDEAYLQQQELQENLAKERKHRLQLEQERHRLQDHPSELLSPLRNRVLPFTFPISGGHYDISLSPPGLSSDGGSDSSSSPYSSPNEHNNPSSSSSSHNVNNGNRNVNSAEAQTVSPSLMDKWNELQTLSKGAIVGSGAAGAVTFIYYLIDKVNDYILWKEHTAIVTNQNTKKSELIKIATETKYPDVLAAIYNHKNCDDECKKAVLHNNNRPDSILWSSSESKINVRKNN